MGHRDEGHIQAQYEKIETAKRDLASLISLINQMGPHAIKNELVQIKKGLT